MQGIGLHVAGSNQGPAVKVCLVTGVCADEESETEFPGRSE